MVAFFTGMPFVAGMQRVLVIMMVLLGTSVSTVWSQDSEPIERSGEWETFVELVLEDGTRLVGHIQSRSEGELVFVTTSGTVHRINPARIYREREVRGRIESGRFYAADPNLSRTFFAPTGRSVGKGDGYLVLHELFFLSAGYGVGSGITLSAGVSLIPGAGDQLVWFAPKVTFLERPNFALSTGVLLLTITGSSGAGGILYGAATVGDHRRSLSFGTGFFYGDGEIESRPVFQLSGDATLGRGVKVMTENYMMPGVSSNTISSVGLRFIVTPRFTVDLAGFTVTGEDAPVLPWLGIAWGW